jgi:hypothetical protein
MERLLAAGLLYLIVVAIVLAIKPSMMFTDEGAWKEFGIGRNPATHTWMPFWLFATLWALVSYILIVLLFAVMGWNGGLVPGKESSASASTPPVNIVNASNLDEEEVENIIESIAKSNRKSRLKGKAMNLPDGYYVLNTDATEAAGGVPKYVYIGKGLPENS